MRQAGELGRIKFPGFPRVSRKKKTENKRLFLLHQPGRASESHDKQGPFQWPRGAEQGAGLGSVFGILCAQCYDESLGHKCCCFSNLPSHSTCKQDLWGVWQHSPGRSHGYGLLPCTSLHPEMMPAQCMTTSCPEATKNKTKLENTKAGCVASFFHLSEKLHT